MNKAARRTTGARAASRKRTPRARQHARARRPLAGRRVVREGQQDLTVPVAVVEEVAVTEITFGGPPAAIVGTEDGEEAEFEDTEDDEAGLR